ncbi:hypothetical protein ABZ756_01995 [Mammaliicoccus sciuri]
MSENNNQKKSQQKSHQHPDYKVIEKRESFQVLREHDNSSLVSLMSQIDTNKNKKK